MSFFYNRNGDNEYNKRNIKSQYNKGYIDGMEYVLQELPNFANNICFETECSKTIDKMIEEIVESTIEELGVLLNHTIDEVNTVVQDEEALTERKN